MFGIRNVTRTGLLLAAVSLGACSDDNNGVTPPANDPPASVAVAAFFWQVSGVRLHAHDLGIAHAEELLAVAGREKKA